MLFMKIRKEHLEVHQDLVFIFKQIEKHFGKRINAGLAFFHSSHLQSYVEAGKTYDINNKVLQKPLRYEAGIQYENLNKVFHGLGLYSAIDLSTYQESDWDINTNFQFGLIYTRDERRWRFGIEYYDGRSQLGEFFQDNERCLGIGLWIDI